MKQFFLRAVKAQLPVKANTDLSHRPALVAESLSLSAFTMAFLSSTLEHSKCYGDAGVQPSRLWEGAGKNL